MKQKIITLYILSTLTLFSCNNSLIQEKELAPKNIILMIGDGMGLGQITAAMYANNNTLSLEKIIHIGLLKTHSASSIITDSAAGATAFSTGEKTYNGSINMSVDTLPLTPITYEIQKMQKKTGIIATSSVTHATPACFYGNQKNRYGVGEGLAQQFIQSDIDILMGGGEDYFNNRSDNQNLLDSLKKKNYIIIDSITDNIPENTQRLINFCAPKEPNSKINGRNDFLPIATEKGLEVLNNNNEKGFFLMIEGSQIDWGGHDNDSEYIISETIDFDNTIEKVLQFAKQDQETLVLITADHETGGYGITGQNKKSGKLETGFLNDDHTATMVPIFAFGPGAEKFVGIYDNTEIYKKILTVFKK